MNNNVMNKEAIQLLNASTDSDSASDLQFALAPQPTVQVRRKIRTKRKHNKRDGNGTEGASSFPPCSFAGVLKVASISFCVGGVLILGWVVMLLHSEVQQLTTRLANVPTSIDETTITNMQKSIRELSANQSFTYEGLQNCSRTVSGFQRQTGAAFADVAAIKDSLKDAPQMMNIGKELDSLKSSLAAYEATISDLKLSLNDLKTSTASPLSLVDALNATVQGQIDFVTADLHHHHELITALENTTAQLSSAGPSRFEQRVDAIHSAVARLESQQMNTTATLRMAMNVIQQMSDFMARQSKSP